MELFRNLFCCKHMTEETKYILFLDLDGVLITTPPWKSDEISSDGFSEFNSEAVDNLNYLLNVRNCEIWLSSARRKATSIKKMNSYFKNRGILQEIVGYIPTYIENNSSISRRKAELESFIVENNIEKYIILDDDKSLNGLLTPMKSKLILTNSWSGFTKEKLVESLEKTITNG